MSETNQAAAAPPNDLASSTPGEYLRRLREEKGHTHAAVGMALHLTVHYIKALESDEYGKLPGLTFVKGYLRSYARFLGADVDNVLARFDEHITGLLDAGQHTARIERSKRRQDQALRWGVGAGLVVVAGIAAGWWFMRDAQPADVTVQSGVAETRSQPVVAESVPASVRAPAPASVNVPPAAASFMPPVQAPTPAGIETTVPAPVASSGFGDPTDSAAQLSTEADPSAVSTATATGARQVSLIGAGDDELSVRFNGSSWIEVDDGNMVRLYNDMLSAGDSLIIRGQAPFRVLLGDAANVAVSLNASALDISPDIRPDRTARLVLGAPAARPSESVDASSTSAPAAAAAGAEVSQ